MSDLHRRLRDTAALAARLGGRAALARFRDPALATEWKADDSPVTAADRAAESTIRELVLGSWPDDAWLGEETGEEGGGSGRRWIVDPIDGTRNFVRGVPLWATLVACEEETAGGPQVVAAAASLPALDEHYEAFLGGGARCGGLPIRVSSTNRLGQALWCFETPEWFRLAGLDRVFSQLATTTGLQRGLGDAYGHLLVASGRAEIVVEPSLAVWDVAATSLIVEEAGGRFTTLEGTRDLRSGNAIVTNRHLHEDVVRLIARDRRPPGQVA